MVVAVEPISLTIGAVALASLFSTCIECFDYFKAGQALEEDFQLLLVKLDVEKTRLLIWGNAVGVLKPKDEGRVLELNDSQKVELIERCLESIKLLLSDTDKLQSLYGLRSIADAVKGSRSLSILSTNSMSVFRTSYLRFSARFAGIQSRSTLARRTRWAVHDKTKFEGLVNHLKDLIDGLNQIVPVKRETQDQIMHDDIGSILDISKLRLIESACEGNYMALSKAASIVITASEFGTIDRRNIEEWLGDAGGVSEEEDADDSVILNINQTLPQGAGSLNQGKLPLASSNTTDTLLARIFESIPGLHYLGCIYFVLTGQCRKLASQSPCQLNDLGENCMVLDNSILSHNTPTARSIGKQIANTLKPEQFTDVDLVDLMGRPEDDDLRQFVLPVATIFIYCAPCACLVATAFAICEAATTTVVKFIVRPDDRLVSSCCSQGDRTTGLASIMEAVRNVEFLPFRLAQYIDSIWVEQRLYEIEEETDLQRSIGKTAESAGKVFSSHHSLGTTAGIVILGELEYCLPILRSLPFKPNPRVPKENEIFRMKKTYQDGKRAWTRKFLGTFTSKAVPLTSTRTSLFFEALPAPPSLSTSTTTAPLRSTRSTSGAFSSGPETPGNSYDFRRNRASPDIVSESSASKRQKLSPARSDEVEEATA